MLGCDREGRLFLSDRLRAPDPEPGRSTGYLGHVSKTRAATSTLLVGTTVPLLLPVPPSGENRQAGVSHLQMRVSVCRGFRSRRPWPWANLLSNPSLLLPLQPLAGLEFWRWTRRRTGAQCYCPHTGGGGASALRTTGASPTNLGRTAQRPQAAPPGK